MTEPEIERIVDIMVNDLRARLAERRMTLEVGDAPGRSPTRGSTRYGARPLRRFIAYEVATRMSRALLAGEVHEGAVIRIEPVERELAVRYENPKCERPAA